MLILFMIDCDAL